MLFPAKAISKVPAFFTNYCEKDNEDCMYTVAIMKAWKPVHWPNCGWYLDCPLKSFLASEIVLQDTLEPRLKGMVLAPAKVPTKDPARKGKKRKLVKVQESIVVEDDVTMDEVPIAAAEEHNPSLVCSEVLLDVPSSSNISPRMPARTCKNSWSQKVLPSNTQVFESPPKRRNVMRNILPQTMQTTSSEFILNNCFVRIVQEKQKNKAWPQAYEDIMSFLSKVSYFVLLSILF